MLSYPARTQTENTPPSLERDTHKRGGARRKRHGVFTVEHEALQAAQRAALRERRTFVPPPTVSFYSAAFPSTLQLPRKLPRPLPLTSFETLHATYPHSTSPPIAYIADHLKLMGFSLWSTLATTAAEVSRHALPDEINVIQKATISRDMAPTHMLAVYQGFKPLQPKEKMKIRLYPVHDFLFDLYCPARTPLRATQPSSSPQPQASTSSSTIEQQLAAERCDVKPKVEDIDIDVEIDSDSTVEMKQEEDSIPRDSMPTIAAGTSRRLPVVKLPLCQPETFPYLLAYLYCKRADALLSMFFPCTVPAYFYHVEANEGGPEIERFARQLARQYPITFLAVQARVLRWFCKDVAALGISDPDLWRVMDVAWEISLASLAISTGNTSYFAQTW